MSYAITDECIACGACESECPAEAIGEGEEKYVIDSNLCTDCGTCADQCPVEAIVPGEEK
ncbi:MAG: 4Fe-4S binding protein [Syntrophales bacterium LBB04]|nr:4Fe-4S binding protein [Syntrophales bacterium LBB04]